MGPVKRGHGEGEYKILESGKVQWRVRVRYPDGTNARPSGTAKNITAARKAVEAAKAEAEAGRRPVALGLTVSQMVTEYMEAKKARWADRTAWNNKALYDRHIVPCLGEKRAAGIQPKDLRAYFKWLGEGGLGDSGQRQIHVLLSGAYKRAVGDGLLKDNPAAYGRPEKAARQAEKVKHFTPAERALFIAAALEDRLALPLAFLGYTGMRIGEALALTWEDYGEDPKAKGAYFVSVSKTRSEFEGKAYTGRPKTAAGERRVPLGRDAVALVEDMRRRVRLEAGSHGNGVGPYIFPSVDGRPMRQDVARSVMRRTCEAAGVPLLSPHALRHSVATYLLSEGWDAVSVAAFLGHAQSSTTMNIYGHGLRDKIHDMAQTLTLNGGLSSLPVKGERPPKAAPASVSTPSAPSPRRPRKGGPRRG
ncbi:tyrosine-type recombinase/integrase [Deinococcus altitudinis]|uniref:tyrosine-type recombinase/integrase n=1 Tax=Deinococcus altitudinis TaxID=468914 RepID=UPI00389197F0